jgi:signal transduction histidine kinase
MTRILVVEDEEVIRQSVCDILQWENYDVLGASNGMIGLQLSREQRPDLIICDILMPELNGFEVLERLRGDSETAMIPFIFLTARADYESMRTGMGLGADDYLLKPFTQVELLTAIRVRLDRQHTIEKQHLQATLRRLIQAQDVERQQTAQQLSDVIAEGLAGLKAILGTLRGVPDTVDLSVLAEAQQQLNHLSESIHLISSDLHPDTLDQSGLLTALHHRFELYTQHTQVKVHFQSAGLEQRFLRQLEASIFRIIEEALNNIAYHTAVREAFVYVGLEQNHLLVRIDDKGNGFDLEKTLSSGKTLGLIRMYGYATLVGGQLTIQTARGKGTHIQATLPVLNPGDEPQDLPESLSAPYKAGTFMSKMRGKD